MTEKKPVLDKLLHEWWEPVWRCCFALVLEEAAAHQAAYRTFLHTVSRPLPEGREAQREVLLRNTVRICEDYYYKKPRRKPGREVLDGLWFPVDGVLYALFRCSFSRRAAFWIHVCMDVPLEDTAKILGVPPRRAARLLRLDLPYTAQVLQNSAKAVCPPEEEEKRLTDELLVRLDESYVSLEVGLRRFKSALDRAVPWIALGLLLFGLAAAVYSALRL